MPLISILGPKTHLQLRLMGKPSYSYTYSFSFCLGLKDCFKLINEKKDTKHENVGVLEFVMALQPDLT